MIKLIDILNEAKRAKCPPATQDIELNLKNRQSAIDEQGYGPADPSQENKKFWKKKMDMWQVDSAEELNSSTAYRYVQANLAPVTAAVTSILLRPSTYYSASWAAGTSFYLYGVKNA